MLQLKVLHRVTVDVTSKVQLNISRVGSTKKNTCFIPCTYVRMYAKATGALSLYAWRCHLGTCSVVTARPLCRLGSHRTHQPANALAPHYHYQLPLSVGWHLPSDEERMQWTNITLNISIQDMYKLYIGDATMW